MAGEYFCCESVYLLNGMLSHYKFHRNYVHVYIYIWHQLKHISKSKPVHDVSSAHEILTEQNVMETIQALLSHGSV